LSMQSRTSNIRLADACDLFEENMPDILEAVSSNLLDDIREQKEQGKALGTSWVADEVRAMTFENKFRDRIQRLKLMRVHHDAKVHPERYKGRITPSDIERARETPIQNINPNKMKRLGSKYLGLCPFHNDKRHPAFYVNKKNRYKCYTCHEYGDAIDFYMKIHNVSFIKAVNMLK